MRVGISSITSLYCFLLSLSLSLVFLFSCHTLLRTPCGSCFRRQSLSVAKGVVRHTSFCVFSYSSSSSSTTFYCLPWVPPLWASPRGRRPFLVLPNLDTCAHACVSVCVHTYMGHTTTGSLLFLSSFLFLSPALPPFASLLGYPSLVLERERREWWPRINTPLALPP